MIASVQWAKVLNFLLNYATLGMLYASILIATMTGLLLPTLWLTVGKVHYTSNSILTTILLEVMMNDFKLKFGDDNYNEKQTGQYIPQIMAAYYWKRLEDGSLFIRAHTSKSKVWSVRYY